MELFDIIVSFLSLSILEIVLGIDNIVFLAIITQRLPKHSQARARKLGLTLAWMMRLLLLASALWIIEHNQPILFISRMEFSLHDIFMLVGGMFLIVKSLQEIHAEMEPLDLQGDILPRYANFIMVVLQIGFLDIIFSLDSVLTAIGLTQYFWLMGAAITVAIIAMIFASEVLSRFVEKNPSIKMLALALLILIGVALIADGFKIPIAKPYLYFAMGFALFVEILNMIKRKRGEKSLASKRAMHGA